MALPVASTPTLVEQEAVDFLRKVFSPQNKRVELVPTPGIKSVRERILRDARRTQ